MFTQSRLRFHYDHIIRPDLLLKSHYTNTMQIPRLCKVIVMAQVARESVKEAMVALEMICGQRCVLTTNASSPYSKGVSNKVLHRSVATAYTDCILHCCLRNDKMYHFVEKLITILCFHDYAVQIQHNTIQIPLNVSLLRLFQKCKVP